ncbi:MAG: hypothetical protein V1861_00005 [Candidatus Micrarchaeota archaeon]
MIDVTSICDFDGGTLDGGPDAGITPTECRGTAVDSFNSVINASTPVNVGNYVFEYAGTNASGDTLLNITCGGGVVGMGIAFPIGVLIAVPTLDGKVIEVTSNHNAPTWTHCTIDVVGI